MYSYLQKGGFLFIKFNKKEAITVFDGKKYFSICTTANLDGIKQIVEDKDLTDLDEKDFEKVYKRVLNKIINRL